MYNSNYIVSTFFEEDSFYIIEQLLNNDDWVDGSVFIDESNNFKLKQEQVLNSKVNLNQLVSEKVRDDLIFFSYCVPKLTSPPYISKMIKNDFYKIHYENVTVGDFSTILFLNEPEEYEGGELCIIV